MVEDFRSHNPSDCADRGGRGARRSMTLHARLANRPVCRKRTARADSFISPRLLETVLVLACLEARNRGAKNLTSTRSGMLCP